MSTTDTTTRRLVVVSAGLSTPSSTRMLAERIAHATTTRLSEEGITTEVTIIELRDHAMAIAANLVNGFAEPALEDAISALTTADGAILATPIFTTSYSGLFKSFVDLVEPDALTDLPILIAATGGSERHSLALDYALRPLFVYQHAVVVPTGVYAATSDWGSTGAGSEALGARIDRAAGELAALVRTIDRHDAVRDPFRVPAGFDPSGRR